MLPLFQTAGISPSVLHREGCTTVFTLSVAAVIRAFNALLYVG